MHVLKPAGYGLIERLSSDGRNLASIAAALGVSGETFRALRRRDPEAQEALERGRAALGGAARSLRYVPACRGRDSTATVPGKFRD